jgi:hypothetical protein
MLEGKLDDLIPFSWPFDFVSLKRNVKVFD